MVTSAGSYIKWLPLIKRKKVTTTDQKDHHEGVFEKVYLLDQKKVYLHDQKKRLFTVFFSLFYDISNCVCFSENLWKELMTCWYISYF